MTHKKYFLIALIVLLAGLLIGCGGSGDSSSEESGAVEVKPREVEIAGDAAEGETQYQALCSACHGPDATGLPNLGKDLTTSEFLKNKSDAEFVEFIKTGRPSSDPENTTGIDMPPKGGNPALTDEDMANIVAYVRTLEK